ncbi:H-2 class II histocompatibility antigen, A-U alpha chain-like [Neoarius graeffei]|uniref:H-2 class II histocompatibility antigen, A-U alpha chain-like n=1 Tax=Neoarius graeffei TaxID=443677 RepID=UPI00298C0D1E|nr:H-2 class II histocompatibility antigen, A-U alpha chain-like [Neoarius graeffei]
MKLFLIFFTLMCVRDTESQFKHQDLELIECSEKNKEYMLGSDGDEMFYADFEKKKVVIMLPPFTDLIGFPGAYESAKANLAACQQNLKLSIEDFKAQPEPQDAPQSSIYLKENMELGSENMLICHFTRFFPPPVTVRWTKNSVDVTEQSTLSRYYPNEDKTYNQFSHLPFTPQEGDVYSCTVEHEALETPDTKTWEVDVELPSVGPSVVCGVGLAVGLLGVATGTFFLVKGNRCN